MNMPFKWCTHDLLLLLLQRGDAAATLLYL
jgi:hypothetical protein